MGCARAAIPVCTHHAIEDMMTFGTITTIKLEVYKHLFKPY